MISFFFLWWKCSQWFEPRVCELWRIVYFKQLTLDCILWTSETPCTYNNYLKSLMLSSEDSCWQVATWHCELKMPACSLGMVMELWVLTLSCELELQLICRTLNYQFNNNNLYLKLFQPLNMFLLCLAVGVLITSCMLLCHCIYHACMLHNCLMFS